MTGAPITVRADMPLRDVVHLFVEARIGGAPVVDAEGNVLGVVSTTDLLVALDQALDDDADEGEAGDGIERFRATTALEVASPEPVWVDPEDDVSSVAQRMRAEGIHRVLVGSAGRPVGVLTAFDLLRGSSGPSAGS